MKIKLVVLIIIFIVIISIFFIDFDKKPLSFNADSIERIEAGFSFSGRNMRLYSDKAQISSWADFFNSLELISPKERHFCIYQRGPSKFEIYYTDGKVDYITYGICCLVYKGDTFVISDSSENGKIHDELMGFGSY